MEMTMQNLEQISMAMFKIDLIVWKSVKIRTIKGQLSCLK